MPELGFARLRFRGDPARPAGPRELIRQAAALGLVTTRPQFTKLFGLSLGNDPSLGKDRVALPVVQSIRSSRRVGPDGQVIFDLIAEVTQKRVVRRDGVEFEFYGGSTVIIDPHGAIRYVVSKGVTNEQRLESQQRFMFGPGRSFWDASGEISSAHRHVFRLLHE